VAPAAPGERRRFVWGCHRTPPATGRRVPRASERSEEAVLAELLEFTTTRRASRAGPVIHAIVRFGAAGGTGPSGRAVDARLVQLALLASQACGTRRSRGAAAIHAGMSQDAAGHRPAGATCFLAQRGSSASRTPRAHDRAPRSGGPVLAAPLERRRSAPECHRSPPATGRRVRDRPFGPRCRRFGWFS
jgi:hypothetical protein